MKVHGSTSADFYAAQWPRIAQGFIELGHTITNVAHEADLIYVNNPPFTQALKDRLSGAKGKLIFNTLDVPWHHIATFDAGALKAQLAQADAVTAISATTARDIEQVTGIRPTVVYNPVMPVTRAPLLRTNRYARFASVGRKSDPNKRTSLAYNALQLLGIERECVALVGADPGWGAYLGVLSDENVNRVYNSVDFVLVPSHFGGIELPMIESMAAGVIPVVCNDLWTRAEFLLPALFPEYDDVAPNAQSIARFIAQYLEDGTRMADMKERLHSHYAAQWAHHFSPQGVAGAILRVYDSIS